MTTQIKSGTVDRITTDDPSNLKAGEGIQIGDTKYDYGADLKIDPTPLIDVAQGRTVAIRLFEFKMNPEVINKAIDKQELFNQHAKQIRTILWADGLQPLEEVSPRVILNISKGEYQIFIPCISRSSTAFIEKAQNLSQALNQ